MQFTFFYPKEIQRFCQESQSDAIAGGAFDLCHYDAILNKIDI